MPTPRVAVLGGGIAGLAAALRLRDRLPQAEITVYEQANRLGGKIATGELAGIAVETGAENFLMRGPTGGESAAVRLVRRVGLADALVHPQPLPAAVAINGTLRPMPRGTLLGVPSDLSMVDGVARPVAELDRDEGRPLLAPGEDIAVGELVRRRLGDEVVDRLVDPLLSGVYAGRADHLSLRATMPGLAAAAEVQPTLVGAARAALAASAAHQHPGPVFGTVQNGLSTLVNATAAALGPARVRLNAAVCGLRLMGHGWRLTIGSAPRTQETTVDAVILAVDGVAAHRLYPPVSALAYASVALVTLALPAVRLPALSGFLVPAGQGMTIKAVTLFNRKWAHLSRADGLTLVRASFGRFGETEILQRGNAELIATAWAEISALLGRKLPAPVAAAVTRWTDALPQYPPGHVDQVARVRASLPATLALAGAAYDGVGIVACIQSGEVAADRIVASLQQSGS